MKSLQKKPDLTSNEEENAETVDTETSSVESETEENDEQDENDSFMNPPADAESEEAPTNEDCYLVEQGA